MVYVINAHGKKEQFSKQKIVGTCLRSGVSKEKAHQIAEKIAQQMHDGMRTHDIFDLIIKELEKENEVYPKKYDLRDAISQLDPKEHEFEKFVSHILREHGYTTKWNRIVQGEIIENQIDIIAIKDSQTHLVEIKHHRNPHRMTGLGDVKQNWATLDDVQNAKPENKNFKSWIIVNTKFSMHARKYAKAKGILLYGWNYPKGKSLRELIEEKRMYPLTILKLDTDIQQKLSAEGFLLVGELATISEQALKTRTKLSQQTVQKLIQEAQTFLNH